MRASSFRYLVKNGIKNLWNNRMMTIASVGTLIACLLIVGFAVLFSINVDNIVKFVGEQNEIVVFVDLEAPEDYSDTLQSQLSQMEGLGEIEYISKDQAMDDVINKYLDGDEELMEGVENDFLPESFRAKILDPEHLEAIISQIESMEYILKVDAPTDLSNTLMHMRKMVNTFGGAIIIALVIVSLVIITNTIRASVFARRKEINIMKYVGANNAFIRIPFIVEGITLGLIAALAAFGIIWGGYNIFLSAVTSESNTWLASISQNLVPFQHISYQILGYFLISGIAVGGFGSAMSMRGHLKV